MNSWQPQPACLPGPSGTVASRAWESGGAGLLFRRKQSSADAGQREIVSLQSCCTYFARSNCVSISESLGCAHGRSLSCLAQREPPQKRGRMGEECTERGKVLTCGAKCFPERKAEFSLTLKSLGKAGGCVGAYRQQCCR